MRVATRKIMALSFSGAYILMTMACLYYDKEVPTEFIAIVSTVVGYYFGKSTALETPDSPNALGTGSEESSGEGTDPCE